MQLVKRLSYSLLGLMTSFFIYYFVTGENVDWVLVGIILIYMVLDTLISNSSLADKLRSKNK